MIFPMNHASSVFHRKKEFQLEENANFLRWENWEKSNYTDYFNEERIRWDDDGFHVRTLTKMVFKCLQLILETTNYVLRVIILLRQETNKDSPTDRR